ncbi:MAG: FMN-binding protein [Jatrophihabitans sp.]
MKRVLLSFTATVLGVVALLSYKTHGQVTTAGGTLPSAGLPGTSTSAGTSTPSPTVSSAPPNPSNGSTQKSASPTSTASSFTGSAVQTRYGTVQVKITVAEKKITGVAFVQLTAFDDRSRQINSDAAPILLQETLTAQSAQIDSVSGASYTSQGYQQSLQSALDRAGLG